LKRRPLNNEVEKGFYNGTSIDLIGAQNIGTLEMGGLIFTSTGLMRDMAAGSSAGDGHLADGFQPLSFGCDLESRASVAVVLVILPSRLLLVVPISFLLRHRMLLRDT